MSWTSLDHTLDTVGVKHRSFVSAHIALRGVVGVVLFLALIPLVYLITRASEKSLSEIAALLLRTKTIEIVSTTAGLVAVVVAINLAFGTALATGLHFVSVPFRRFLVIPAVLPLAIPSYVFTYTWMALIPGLQGFWAAAFILSLTTLPYMILATLIALRRIDINQIEVARSLGLSYSQTFFRVVFPQIRSHISAGALLVGLYAMSDFGAVSLLNVESLTVAIQNMYRASYDRSAAAVISLLLIALSTIFIFLGERFKGGQISTTVAKRSSLNNSLIGKNYLRITVLFASAVYAALGVFVPVYVLISRFVGNPEPIDVGDLIAASSSTISVSFLGALMALAISTPLGILIVQADTRLTRNTERIILITHALPGVVIGLALVSLGSKLGPLYQTTLLLSFGYAFLFLAKGVASITASLHRIPPVLKEVSATLGKSQFKTAMHLVFPIAAPSIGLGFALVFLTAMKELPATLMLRPTGFETLATQVWSVASINRFNEAAPYALILVLIAAVPTFFLSRPDKQDKVFSDQKSGVIRDLT